MRYASVVKRTWVHAKLSLCLALGAVVSMSPLPVIAAPAGAPLDEAKTYYEQGKAKFDTADYLGAIDLWQKAYAALPDDDSSLAVRSALAYNIAAARQKAYELSGEVLELKRARILLNRYVEEINQLVEAGEERDKMLSSAQEKLDQIEKLITDEEAKKAAAAGSTGSAGTGGSKDTQRSGPPGSGESKDPNPVTKDGGINGPGKPLIFAGAGVAGLGVAAGAVGAAFMVIGKNRDQEVTDLNGPDDEDARRTAIKSGKSANTIAIIGGAAGVAFVGTGVALLVIGLKKNKDASARVSPRVWPTFGPGQAGIGLTGRF